MCVYIYILCMYVCIHENKPKLYHSLIQHKDLASSSNVTQRLASRN